MKKSKPKGRGRPRAEPTQAFTQRHVMNISEEMEAGVRRYMDANGIGKLTDAMRQLLVKSLKTEGVL